jgi:DNA polymerase III alpha subunit (gram-positive type)
MKILDYSICFIDTETTGLTLEHEIIEIAVIKVEPYTYREIDRWCVKIKPNRTDNFSYKAAEINGYSDDEWKTAITDKDAIIEFIQKTDDCLIAGHNVSFDLALIRKLAEKYGLELKCHYKPLDTFPLAYVLSFSDLKDGSLSLTDLTRQLDIETQPEQQFGRFKRHTALYDAELTMKCFIKMVEMLM